MNILKKHGNNAPDKPRFAKNNANYMKKAGISRLKAKNKDTRQW